MEKNSSFDIPLEALTRGIHTYEYHLNNAFFAAFESNLVDRGSFLVQFSIERVRNQYNLSFTAEGFIEVPCDRCLEFFNLPITLEDEILVKYDSDNPRVEEEVIYVPYGEEYFNVAKLFFDAIGLAKPMSLLHENAQLKCNSQMLTYLEDPTGPSDVEDNHQSNEIPEDSPWAVLQGLKSKGK